MSGHEVNETDARRARVRDELAAGLDVEPEPLPGDWLGTEAPRCSAHGRTAIEHVDAYANDCTAPTMWADGSPSDECSSCSTYAEGGMHWDTCPNRGRNSRSAGGAAIMPPHLRAPGKPTPDQLRELIDPDALPGNVLRIQRDRWQREAERLKGELDKLQGEQLTVRQASASDPEIMGLARIVCALEMLSPAERGRVLRYLSHRYEPTRTGGLIGGTINVGDRGPGGAPPR
jgi:hypothetical protein